MKLKINSEMLYDIMKAFYSVSNIRIILFDDEYNKICSYPEEDCSFCRRLKQFPHTAKKCLDNDRLFFNECKKSGKLMLYTCHAGLVEGTAPLKHNGAVIAYIMFGQISDLPDREALNVNIKKVCKGYGLDDTEFLKASKSIRLRSKDRIKSVVKIFEACINYIILNEMLLPEKDKIIIKSEAFVKNHLEDVTVESLCKHLNISRTALYDIFRKKTGQGVSGFIKEHQFEKSKELLLNTDMPIRDISSSCGFSDYNYFSRVFKKRYNKSPRQFRKSAGKE